MSYFSNTVSDQIPNYPLKHITALNRFNFELIPIALKVKTRERPVAGEEAAEDDHSSVYPLFSSIICSMSWVGLDLKGSRRIWSSWMMTLFVLSLAHNLALQAYHIARGAGNDAFYASFACFQLFCSLIMIRTFRGKRRETSKLPSLLTEGFIDIPREMVPRRRRMVSRVKRQIRANVALGWMCILFFTFTFIFGSIMEADLDEYMEKYWFGLKSNRKVTLSVTIVETSIYYLATMAPMQFCSLFYAFLCIITSKSFQLFNAFVEVIATKRGEDLTGPALRRLRHQHNHLTSLAEKIDASLSRVAFLMFLIIISDMSKYLYFLFDKVTTQWNTPVEGIFVVCRIMHMLWLFFIISCSASSVSLNSHASLTSVHRLTTLSANIGPNDRRLDLEFHAQALLIKLSGSPVHLTGWSMFPITRGFIITVLGGVLTYTIVMVQMMPFSPKHVDVE